MDDEEQDDNSSRHSKPVVDLDVFASIRRDVMSGVGYGRPPEHTRFKKGRSGNPKGRPLLVDTGTEMRRATLVAAVSGIASDIAQVHINALDLGTASTSNVEDFATAAQGALANTAVQPSALAAVATSGDYNDLDNTPAIPQGTVTSVSLSAPTGFAVSGNPVTAIGTLTLNYASGYQGYTSVEASKLAGIAAGAQVNIKPDWNAASGNAAEILNKPTLGSAAAQDSNAFATSAQGALADSAVQPALTISAGTGLTGGGNLSANRTIALNAASIASLALADSAVQPGSLGALASKDQVSISDISATGTPSNTTYLRGDGTWAAGGGGGGGGQVDEVQAGTGIAVDATDPIKPIVALNSASTASLALADSAVQPAGLASGLAGKFDNPTGTTSQYLRGDGTTATFPTIPAAQVQTDWNATSGISSIANKPATFPPSAHTHNASDINAGTLAIDRIPTGTTGTTVALGDHLHPNATRSTDGFMSAADKTKLDDLLPPISDVGFRNKIINGGFNITQRGPLNSGGPGHGWAMDRWYVRNVESAFQGVLDGEPCLEIGTAGIVNTIISTDIEDVRSVKSGEITVTFDAQYAAGTMPISVLVHQRFGTAGSLQVTTILDVVDVTTTKQRFRVKGTLPSIAGKTINANSSVRLEFLTTRAASGLKISRVSLVEGDALNEDDPFSPRHIQQELALCQRYYERAEGAWIAYSGLYVAGVHHCVYKFNQQKRTVPTVSIVGSSGAGTPTVNTTTNVTVGFQGGSEFVISGLYIDAEIPV